MARKKAGVLLDQIYLQVGIKHRAYGAWKAAKRRMKIIGGGYKGSKEEFQKVIDFWKPYGVKPNKMWYQMYCDGRGAFDPRYIPDTMWDNVIFPYFNNLMWGRSYSDKCAYDRLFPDLNKPRTIIKNSCGRFYDGNQNVITRDEAIQLCLNEARFIVKSSTFSSGGKSIKVFETGEVSEQVVRQIFDDYRINFIIQDLVNQNEYLASLNSTSLNTLRIMSFFFKGKVHILSAQLRIGGTGARVDNYSSGGFACNVNPDGRLSERAVSKANGWATMHPAGYAFSDIVVPSYNQVLEIVKGEHAKLPQLNIIGWDFAVDVKGEPVFIEMNVFPGQNQNGSGPTFGDLTEEVLQDVFIDKSLQGAFE